MRLADSSFFIGTLEIQRMESDWFWPCTHQWMNDETWKRGWAVFLKLSRFLTAAIVICLWSVGVLAGVKLYVFHRPPPAPHLLFPVSDQESLASQIERYLELIRQTPDLMILEPNFEQLQRELNPDRAVPFEPSLNSTKIRAVLHANEFTDFAEDNPRVLRHTAFLQHPAVEGSYLLPLAGDLHLRGSEKISYRAQVARNFLLRIGMGGDDVHPRLYGERITHSGRVSYTRDYSEYQMIRAYNAFSQGLYFGICRGHQIGAVARGDRMYQDISKDGVGKTNDHSNNGDFHSHEGKWNQVVFTHPLLIQLFGRQQLEVNSLHHQAVRLVSGSHSMLGGYSLGDQIVEALVSENGRAIGVQFHPEIATVDSQRQGYNDLRLKFLVSVLDYAWSFQVKTPPYRSCRLVL